MLWTPVLCKYQRRFSLTWFGLHAHFRGLIHLCQQNEKAASPTWIECLPLRPAVMGMGARY